MAAPVAKPYPRIIMTSASNMDPAAGAVADSPASSTATAGPIGTDGIAAHRRLRFRRRRPHRGPVHHRPAAQRIHPVRRRHRPRPLRAPAHRRGPRQRPGRDGRARGFRREAADHRLQLRLRRRAARRPRTLHGPVRDSRDRSDPAGRAPRRRRDPHRPGRRDRHLGHGRLARLRGHLRRRPGPGDHLRGLPGVRALRRGRASPPGRNCSPSPTSTWHRSRPPAWTPWCWAAPTTRCSPA